MMIRTVMLAFACGFIASCDTVSSQQELGYSSYEELQNRIYSDPSSVYVVNFWATWCKPCVAELPDFENIHKNYKNKHVKVILANLDFHSRTAAVVPPFMEKHGLTAEVIHITDEDDNAWINLAYEQWSGAIPATLIFHQGKKVWFFEGKTEYATLESVIKQYLKK